MEEKGRNVTEEVMNKLVRNYLKKCRKIKFFNNFPT